MTISLDVLEAMQTIAGNATSLPAWLERADAVDRDEDNAVFISPESEETSPFNNVHELTVMVVNVEILVRDKAWIKKSDSYAPGIHNGLLSDQGLKQKIVRIRRIGKKWEGKEADVTAGVHTLQYQVQYLSPPDSI